MNCLELPIITDHPALLPPPARVILQYAIVGWTCEQWQEDVPGWQPFPERCDWLPAFIRLLGSADRLPRLYRYSLAGMRYENAPVELMETVERAYAVPGFDLMLVESLADLSIR
jgi:hypothetical protein